jgi:hypothetical protein
VVTAQLPEWKGEFEYNIKHINESYERIASEGQLHQARRWPRRQLERPAQPVRRCRRLTVSDCLHCDINELLRARVEQSEMTYQN